MTTMRPTSPPTRRRERERPQYAIPDAQADAWDPIISTQGYARRMGRVPENKGLLLYPGVLSDDPKTMRAHALIADELNKIPVNIDGSGVLGAEAVPGDFNALRTVPGHKMGQVSIPPVSNEAIRTELGLLSDFATDRDKQIFDQLVKLMFGRAAPAKVPVRREASTGAPDFVNDVAKKKSELRAALKDLPRFLDLIDQDKLIELFIEFNAPIVHTTGERNQADKFELKNGRLQSKDREVNDELAARTGLKRGRRSPADKTVWVNGQAVEGHAATRRRTVYGTAFVPNYVCAAFCASWRAVYLEEFHFTWKHREPAHILEKMKRYGVLVGFDVKQFDQTVPHFLIERFMDQLELYTDKRVVKLIRLLFTAPYMVPWPWMAGKSGGQEFNPLFGATPWDIATFAMRLGLPSGIAINPDSGKLLMGFQYLVVLDRYYGDVLEVGLDVILRGECPRYAMLNMGDDCVLLTSEPGFDAWFEAGEFAVPHNYFALEPERPISFLGNVPYRDDAGELQLAPNVISYLVNWLVPEHGIDSRNREHFWAVGERERRLHYARAPMYSHVKETFARIYEQELGFNPEAIATEAYEQQRKYQNLSTWDALVLQNPEYLHYKVDESQISPEILDLIVTSLPADEVWPLTQPFFGDTYGN